MRTSFQMTDRTASRTLVLEVGKSSDLRALFLSLAEMQTAARDSWHHPQSVRWLERTIACRAYWTPLLQLCHLMPIALALGGREGYLGFFWNLRSTKSTACRDWLAELSVPFAPGAEPVILLGSADRPYELSVKLIPRLACLMHFLHAALGYTAMRDALEPLTGPRVTPATISKTARGLSKLLYDYLGAHLPSTQAHRRTRVLIEVVQSLAGKSFTSAAVDDQAVLAFWDRLIELDSDLGRSYEAAFRACLDLRRLLDRGTELHAFSRTIALGSDRDAGEIDPSADAVLDVVETLDGDALLDQLLEPPADRVKSVNKSELQRLDASIRAGDLAAPLALSLLRLAVFQPTQNKLSQGLRRKLDQIALAELVETSTSQTYRRELDEFEALALHLQQVMLASMAILLRAGRPEAFSLVETLASETELSELRNELERSTDLANAVQRSGIGVRATAAMRKIARQGYRSADVSDGRVVEGHAAGAGPLIEIARRLMTFLDALDRQQADGDWETRFGRDRSWFRDRLRRLYLGDQDG